MKYIICVMLLSLCACTSKTQFGDCIGAFDDKKPNLEYKLSSWNLFLGVVFFELIAPPIFVVVDKTFCPVGNK